METDEFARVLMSKERRERQNPEKIIKSVGVTRGMVVADLGCGPGFFTIPLALAVGKSGMVYAVDSDAGMLSYLRDKPKEAQECIERIGQDNRG